MYYADKIKTLKDIFGTEDVTLAAASFTVKGRRYPVVNDVIVLADPSQYTDFVRATLREAASGAEETKSGMFARDIQFTFGEEWKEYHRILPEHEREFRQYFDIVDIPSLKGKRLCDLGCGMGRWSCFLKDIAGELLLVDFSDAIFVARRNLSGAANCLFFMADLRALPFRDDFADFLFSLGVVHHLPAPCLDEVRQFKRAAPEILVFLYYALDNRPFHFRLILKLVTSVRKGVSRITSPLFRKIFSLAGTFLLYLPLISLGRLLKPLGLARAVPLYDFYHDKSVRRIEQDVYDRFFTRIEQRVTRKEIMRLTDTFSKVMVSDHLPYWHFLCKR